MITSFFLPDLLENSQETGNPQMRVLGLQDSHQYLQAQHPRKGMQQIEGGSLSGAPGQSRSCQRTPREILILTTPDPGILGIQHDEEKH